MSESLLTVLKFCFLALVYLFLARVVRVVLREMKAEKVPTAPVIPPVPVAASVPTAAGAAGAAVAAPPRRGRGGGPALQVVVAGPYEAEVFPLGEEEVTVGRAPGCGVVLADDTFVSQVHARVFRRNREILVEDLGSTNGTFVNGDRIDTTTRVRKGDTVQFGETVMRVVT